MIHTHKSSDATQSIRIAFTRIFGKGTVLGIVVLALSNVAFAADSWVGNMDDGSLISVDPDTHRASRYSDEGRVPMWDGVHRLEDGRTVIVRDGVAIPDEKMLDSWRATPRVLSGTAGNFCEQLVRKVCGESDECGVDKACPAAKQLLRRQGEERRRMPFTPGVQPTTRASLECKEALLTEGFFAACHKGKTGGGPSPCVTLVTKVCGSKKQCGEQEACDAASQLLRMDDEERIRGGSSIFGGQQCQEALANEAYFSTCRESL